MNDERLVQVVPAPRQIEIQKIGFYAFFHFTVNTFTGREWGDGTESPSIFNPEHLDAEQWVRAVKAAGMKGAILTCKHHDGFCLWPSRYTEHSVAFSPYKGGKGDVVREVADECRKYGMKFGVYLSPWDRNHPAYGSGKAYDDYFVNQLEELLTGYGDIFCVWFDGACGEGANGRKQEYDWKRYYETVRKLQPDACISVTGPDVRWCGNEAGDTRESEWSVVPAAMSMEERIAAASQQSDDAAFRERTISSMEQDLGSRKRLEHEEHLIWYPAEVDVSIRPGWFYHPEEDSRVRSLENLLDIYIKSVGGNATLLLNVPPMPDGRINENDVERLKELGDYLREMFRVNLADEAELSVCGDSADVLPEDTGKTGVPENGHRPGQDSPAEALRSDSYDAYCMGTSPRMDVEISWSEPREIRAVVIKEDIRFSQRIEKFEILAGTGGEMHRIFGGTTVGFRKIAAFEPVQADRLVVRILDSRVAPVLSYLGVF